MGERIGGAGDHQCGKSGLDGVAVEDVCTMNCFIESYAQDGLYADAL